MIAGITSGLALGLAFIALVVARQQQATASKGQSDPYRGSEAEIRALHMQLLKMSMDDEDLAAVWPQYQGPVSTVRGKQNKYANLIIQHQRMLYEFGYFDREDATRAMRYLFASPIMRSFWEGRMVARRVLNVANTREAEFDEIADTAFHESAPPEPPKPPRSRRDADVIDLDGRRNSESDAA